MAGVLRKLSAGQSPVWDIAGDGSQGYCQALGIAVGGSSTPSAPTNLVATPGQQQVSLTWTAPSGATSYKIYRGTTPGGESGTPIATGVAVTNYLDSGLADGTTYYYYVKATNATGDSVASSEANATTNSSLLNQLAAYWTLEEATGTTRLDKLGVSNLLDTNNVVKGAAPAGTVFGGSAGFTTASSQKLACADNSNLEQSGSFTIAFWYNASLAATMGLITKDDSSTNREWGVYYSSGTIIFYIYDSAGTQRATSKTGASGTHFAVATFDNTAKTVNLSLDNGSVASASSVNVIHAPKAAPVTLGAFGGNTSYLTGNINAVGLWKRVLTSGEITKLYAAGAGLQYPWN